MTGSDSTQAKRFGWPAAFAIVLVIALLIAGGIAFWVLRSAGKIGNAALEGGRRAFEQVEEIARAFRTGTVATTFTSYASEVRGTSYLQFATLEQKERFERTDSASTLWGQLELPDVVVEATAETEYTYYLDLDGPWKFELAEDTIQVLAPEIRFNRPAIDPSTLRYEIRRDSLLRDEARALAQLRSGLSQMAEARARDNIPLIREIGRRKTEEFVANWLFRDFGAEARRYRVEVRFADEPGFDTESRPAAGRVEIEGARP
jgi:hypothetical protein